MKFLKYRLILVTALVLVSFMTACGSGQQIAADNKATSNSTQSFDKTAVSSDSSKSTQAANNSQDKTFTAAELAKYNGQNGNPAYVAIDGVVYDVSLIKQWMNGKHHGLTAGKDLSKEINTSPHGKGVLKMLPVVGKYAG